MKTARALAVLSILPAIALAQNSIGVRILLGVSDAQVTNWDGSLQAQNAQVLSLDPWRFEGDDQITGTTWRLSTHPVRLFGGGAQLGGGQVRQIVANGVVANLSAASESAVLQVTTPQGNFEIKLSDIPYGKSISALNGRAFADRVPPTSRMTETPDEEDYPSAAADKSGGMWVAYSVFRHHPEHDQLRGRLQKPLTDFSKLKDPPGGDQIYVRHYSGTAWEPPQEITAAGGDLYRTAIAIDGKGRPWVFWSQNNRGNFDIFARAIENGKPGRQVQISKEPGSDIDPVAATDSSGNVWVAWQGWRNGRAAIFSATQTGDGFASPVAVSQSASDEWNPAIAASQSGRVSVAYDSYRNGNYDVYVRTASGGKWDSEKPVAATARYEAYPSLAYDRDNRLWIAYEEGGQGWGKDFGAYNTQGIALYQGRALRVKGIEANGRMVELPQDVGEVLPGAPSLHAERSSAQNELIGLDPDADNSRKRPPSRPAGNQQNPKNTMPRLTVDASGRIWLAFRSAHPIWWNPLGTVWTEHLVSFDGSRWSLPVFLNHTDNLLDNRPAIVSLKEGQLMVVGSSDSRRQFQLGERRGPTANDQPAPPVDPYNNDLYVSEVVLGPARHTAAVISAKAPSAGPGAASQEAAVVKRLRDYRTQGSGLRILRGEFHRHSEVSMDGGFDGSLLDQWRYILDSGSLDWVGCCDHDNGGGREYTWWITQKLTDIFYSPGKFVPMFSYERSVAYPEGHRNVIFVQRGIRTLPRLPISKAEESGPAPDTQMLYAYLKAFNGIVASHTSGTNMGTDWRDNDPKVEPVVEIYQGDRQNYEMPDAPRSNSEKDSIGGWRPKGFVNLALQKGYRLGFQASSDHVSTHMSYCNILAKDATRESVLEGLQKRHVYGATDNILADVRSGSNMMGDAFSTSTAPSLQIKLAGTSKFAKVHIIKDNKYVYSVEPGTADVSFTWRDNAPETGKTSYYYVRGEQDNGEIVWVSPMWITYTGSR